MRKITFIDRLPLETWEWLYTFPENEIPFIMSHIYRDGFFICSFKDDCWYKNSNHPRIPIITIEDDESICYYNPDEESYAITECLEEDDASYPGEASENDHLEDISAS